MSGLVERLLSGDTITALTTVPGWDDRPELLRNELTTFVLRGSHFWGMTDVIMRPDREANSAEAISFLYSDLIPDLVPLVFPNPGAAAGTETVFTLQRSVPAPRYIASPDYELIWTSGAGTPASVLEDAIAGARDVKVAVCLGGDLWLLQKCVLPQYMRAERYFRVSTPERQVPFFTTWERDQFAGLLQDGQQAEVKSTAFQAGIVGFSDGRFIWFNSPSSGAWQNYQEMRLYAARRPTQGADHAG